MHQSYPISFALFKHLDALFSTRHAVRGPSSDEKAREEVEDEAKRTQSCFRAGGPRMPSNGRTKLPVFWGTELSDDYLYVRSETSKCGVADSRLR